MQVAALIHTHGDPPTTRDTVESVECRLTHDIGVIVDAAGWHHFAGAGERYWLGYHHGYDHNPYRNVFLGLERLFRTFPDADWYVYLDFDVLLGLPGLADHLAVAADQGVWLLGCDLRVGQAEKLAAAQSLLRTRFDETFYLLGCFLCLHRRFAVELLARDFFGRLLPYAAEFQNGHFPLFDGWDLTEYLLPTCAANWGGVVQEFSAWLPEAEAWRGGWEQFPVRWKPEIEAPHYETALVLHPAKHYAHPARRFHRELRQSGKVN